MDRIASSFLFCFTALVKKYQKRFSYFTLRPPAAPRSIARAMRRGRDETPRDARRGRRARTPPRTREGRERCASPSPPPAVDSSGRRDVDDDDAVETARATVDDEAHIAMVTLDANEPVASNIGARAHVTMSPKRMREMGVAAGGWTTVRCYATPRDDDGATRRTSDARGRRKGSRASGASESVAMERAMRVTRDAEAARRAGRATACKALARMTMELDDDDEEREAADEEDADVAYGSRVVLARAWPAPKLPEDGIALSKRVWLSMGCPPGGSVLGVAKRDDIDEDVDGFNASERACVTLKLWAMETSVGGEATVWLERGLRAASGERAERRRGVLEALAKRALDGRGVLVGNIVRLPLLGTSALFEVTSIEPNDVFGDGRGAEISSKTRVVLHPRDVSDGPEKDADGSNDADSSSDSDDIATSAVKRASRAASSQRVSFENLGGVRNHEAALRELVSLPLERPEVFTRCGVKPPRGVLLYGPPGSGKTRLARAAAHASNAKLFVVNGPELVGAHVGESEDALRGVFAAAIESAPSVVLLDELDAIAPAREQSASSDDMMSSRVVATLLSIFDGGGKEALELHRVVVVGTTNRPDAIERALRRPGRFDRELEVGVPTPDDRLEILRAHLRGLNHDLSDEYVEDVSRRAHGFVGADVAALCQHAAMRALTRVIERAELGHGVNGAATDVDDLTRAMDGVRLEEKITEEDFEAARVKVRPSALREVAVEVPDVRWDDVGGLDDVKNRLKEAVEWAEKHPDAMKRVGASPPKGVLLYGPPGCSKTMLARAVASASGRNFISIKGSELFSKWVGDSEKAVRSVFARARTSAPSVIFIDEVDGLAGTRGGEGHGAPSVQDRVITQLLGEMDGLLPSANVTVVAATNRPDLVDGALLRPGRFDRLMYVPPPTSSEDRLAILRVQFKNTPLADDVDLNLAAMSTNGYTGADLSAICREAALAALEENIDATEVCARHVGVAMGRVRASPAPRPELLDMYEKFQRM